MLEPLNPEQRRAVTAGDGPLLVLAGAGSGKTRVLTTRIALLIHERQVPAWRILAFTFTNKAAREMRGRVEQLIGERASECWLGTFHATGVRILRREAERLGWDRNFVIYDTEDTEAALKELISGRTLPRHVSPAEVRVQISQWKNAATDPDAAAGEARDAVERALAVVYADYDKALRRNNAFDFDDLIVRPVQLFESDSEVLERYAHRFLHVLVDEFQDTNGIQMRFIELLASGHGNLFVVGDDDQSIYGWRGARIENILEFDSRFTSTQVFRLEQNYRSTSLILNAANGLIAHNQGRKGKKLWTAGERGESVRLHVCMDEEDEGVRVVGLVQKLTAAGRSRGDVGVLYRTNAQSRALEDAMRRHNIPYQLVGGTRFYERREVRDMLAYFKAVVNPADSVSLLRVINVPRRGIGDTTVGKLQALAQARDWTLGQALEHAEEAGVAGAAGRRIGEYVKLLADLRHLAEHEKCVAVVNAVLEATSYFEYLKQSEPSTYQARRENVEELVSAAQAFAEESEDPSLRAFLEEISLLSDVDSLEEQVEQVTLMTLHSAKGLEFPVICVTGLEEGLLPHQSNLDSRPQIEEERRLFYVGMTRAKQELHLFCAHHRRRFGDFAPMMQSRFLAELPPECLTEEPVPGTEVGRGRRPPERRPAWRDYAEGDPDAFWRNQGLRPDRDLKVETSPTYEDDFSQEPEPHPQKAPSRLPRSGERYFRQVLSQKSHTRGELSGDLGPPDPHAADAVQLVPGMRVRHAKFGEGIVEGVEGSGAMLKVRVVFGRHTTKKFVARYARLEPVL